jgi:hypothetical protein
MGVCGSISCNAPLSSTVLSVVQLPEQENAALQRLSVQQHWVEPPSACVA